MKKNIIHYEGAAQMRQRLVLSILSGKSVKITKIRENEANPGLKDYEISFLRLLDKITDGGRTIINETGTQLRFDPGQLVGNKETIKHQCPNSRSVTYFLEALILMVPFSRNVIRLKLLGVTNDPNDISVDTFRTVSLPLLKHFGIEGDQLTCKLNIFCGLRMMVWG